MENKYHIGKKTFWEKEKFLVTRNFSFSHNIFHCYVSLARQNVTLCGNELKGYWIRKSKSTLILRRLICLYFKIYMTCQWTSYGLAKGGLMHLGDPLHQANNYIIFDPRSTFCQTIDSTES